MMLNWFVNYCNYYGYYFYDNNNYLGLYQTYNQPARSLKTNRKSNNNCNSGGSNNKEKNVQAQPTKFKEVEAANLKKGLETKIEQGSKGYDILLKMGYQDGQGLGKNGKGIMEPVDIVKKNDRKGLTAKEEETQNRQGVARSSRGRRRRGRRGGRAKKAAKEPVAAVNRAEQVADNIKAAKKDNHNMEGEAKPRRKHSPIRPPSPTPKNETVANIIATKQNSIKSSAVKTKENFSINDPCTPQFLRALVRCFHSEIELMQLRLEAAPTRNPIHSDDELIVARIVIGQNQTVAEHAFEYIRTELVGWIGVYQEEGMDTPIFHGMTNNNSHITVVCDDDYAYKCLVQCIDDITQMETMGSIRIIRLPTITPLVYCFDAVYEGVARDSALFLTQIHLHKSKLYSYYWVVVSHEVYPEERRTHFIFLIDERSALALNFHYRSNFFICMQKVTFRSRGIVTEEYLK